MKTIIATVLVIAGAFAGNAEAKAAEPCNPAGNLGFLCGPLNAEDLLRVPGTDWVIASGMDGGSAGTHGSLHLVNARDKSWKMLFSGINPQVRPDKATYGDCPGAPDLGKFSAHGITWECRRGSRAASAASRWCSIHRCAKPGCGAAPGSGSSRTPV